MGWNYLKILKLTDFSTRESNQARFDDGQTKLNPDS